MPVAAAPFEEGRELLLADAVGAEGIEGGVVQRDPRFDVALDRNALLSPASTGALWSPTVLNDGTVAPYGLGWYVQDLDEERAASVHKVLDLMRPPVTAVSE